MVQSYSYISNYKEGAVFYKKRKYLRTLLNYIYMYKSIMGLIMSPKKTQASHNSWYYEYAFVLTVNFIWQLHQMTALDMQLNIILDIP